jgi:hypothetical protein
MRVQEVRQVMRQTGDEENRVTTQPFPLTDLPALISVPRAAKILGLSRASAYRYAAAGELPTKRFGGRVYIVTAKIRPLFDSADREVV